MTPKTSNAVTAIVGAATLATGLTWSTPAAASEPFLGTVKYVGFNFAPRGWALCDGQLLQISQYTALFSLLGTIYGGDGRTTFGLPDMRGRMPVHFGTDPGLSSRTIGQKAGAERVTLDASQITHGHTLRGNTGAGNQSTPTNHALAQDSADNTYKNEAPSVQMAANSVANSTGAGQAHNNMSPYLGVYCTIALDGLFPSRS